MVVFDSLALSYVYIFLHSFISPETSASDIINGHGRCVCENSYHRTCGHSWSARESWESADRPDNVSLCNWCLTLILQIPEDTRRDIQINNQKKKKKRWQSITCWVTVTNICTALSELRHHSYLAAPLPTKECLTVIIL